MNEIVRLLNGAVDLAPFIKRTIPLGTQPMENGNFRWQKFHWQRFD